MSAFSIQGLKAKNAALEAQFNAAQAAGTSGVETTIQAPADDPTPVNTQPDVAGLMRELEALRHKHSVLEGKYNAEVRDVQRKLKAEKSQPKPVEVDLGLPAEALEQIDPDVIKMVKSAGTKLADEVAQARAESQQLLQRLEEDAQEKLKQRNMDIFVSNLTRLSPGWETIVGPEFQEWAKQTGRFDALSLQWGYPDGATVFADTIAVYKQFKGSNSPTLPHGAVLPGVSSRPGATPTAVGQISAAEVSEFYKNAPRLLMQGRMSKEEYQAKDKLYMAAHNEGRVR